MGTDVDGAAVAWSLQLLEKNPAFADKIEIRLQRVRGAIFNHVVKAGERFAVSICNPPFHSSAEEAATGTLRKLRNLGGAKSPKAILNFGGRGTELWCPGGEVAFVRQMIAESAKQPELCGWFTSLVSKRGNLPAIYRALEKARVGDVRTLVLFAGQKQSRVVAWTFNRLAARSKAPSIPR